MVDDDSLKKGFIVATLISTIINIFTSGINLYDRVRDHSHQQHTDYSQDRKIEDLERRIDRLDRLDRLDRQDAIGTRVGAGFLSPDGAGDPVYQALTSAPPAIRREYERLLAAIGPRFAKGDATARLQLQSLIIDLQASVIQQLQDALDRRSHRRSSSSPRSGGSGDRYGFSAQRLADAATRARNGSIDALRDQYQRLVEDAALPPPPSRHISGYLADSDSGFHKDIGLFCPYALQLQRDDRAPLDLDLDGDGAPISETTFAYCPSCAGRLEISPEHAWKIHKPVVVDERLEEVDDDRDVIGTSRHHRRRDTSPRSWRSRSSERGRTVVVDVVEDRIFVLSNRFVVKCHQTATVAEDRGSRQMGFLMLPPGYACCLCEERRQHYAARGERAPPVTVCSSMSGLVAHVCDEHSVREIMADPDIREIAPRRERW